MLPERPMSDLSADYDQLARSWTHEQLADHYTRARRRGERLPECDQDHRIRSAGRHARDRRSRMRDPQRRDPRAPRAARDRRPRARRPVARQRGGQRRRRPAPVSSCTRARRPSTRLHRRRVAAGRLRHRRAAPRGGAPEPRATVARASTRRRQFAGYRARSSTSTRTRPTLQQRSWTVSGASSRWTSSPRSQANPPTSSAGNTHLAPSRTPRPQASRGPVCVLGRRRRRSEAVARHDPLHSAGRLGDEPRGSQADAIVRSVAARPDGDAPLVAIPMARRQPTRASKRSPRCLGRRDRDRGIAIARPAPRPTRKQSRGPCRDAATGVIGMSPGRRKMRKERDSCARVVFRGTPRCVRCGPCHLRRCWRSSGCGA